MKDKRVRRKTGDIIYDLRRSRRARYMRLVIEGRGTLTVVAPPYALIRDIEQFIYEKRHWIKRQLSRVTQNISLLPTEGTIKTNYTTCRARALRIIRDRVRYYAKRHQFTFGKISVRDTTRQWGSCSSDGNLSFSYKLFFLDEELIDYVIVHELVHTVHMNHGADFHALVASVLPDYHKRELKLRKYVL